MSTVFVRKASYEYEGLKSVIHETMGATLKDTSIRGKKVLIKPNFLCPAKPEQAIITHPMVIRAVVEYVLEKGGAPFVSDSNAMGAFKKIVEDGGIADALRGLNVEIKPFRESRSVVIGDPIIRSVELSVDALEADLVINLPKLKTHSQMLMTLGIKNLFGCVVGFRKPEWHFRVGTDRELFARMLVLLCKAINPAVTILDGILAMEGDGPGTGGTPREIGVIVGSDNAAALDIAVCRMLHINPEIVPTNKVALSLNLAGDINIDGDLPEIRHFKLPAAGDMIFGPKAFHGLMRKHLTHRPSVAGDICRLCGECWKYCPAKAISSVAGRNDSGKKHIVFDYDKCIRCYCCLEVCPHSALRKTESLTGKIVRKFLR